MHKTTDALITNVFVLAQGLLLVLQFKGWDIYEKRKRYFRVTGVMLLLVWLVEHVFLKNIHEVTHIYRVYYSLVLVFLSLEEINTLFIAERKHLLFNSKFILCVTFIVYFLYKGLIEIFFMYELTASTDFSQNLYLIFIVINVFCNLSYALAIIWMPSKQKFILPY